jgi:hypothetical protein
MAKKLKITEEQLKRLMVLKEENQEFDDFDTQIQPEEIPSTDYDNMNDMKNSNLELERMVDSFIKQFKEKATYGVDEAMIDDLCNQMRQGLSGEETRPPLSIGFRESVKKIKSEFQRYL